eukprot:g344.t1
MALQESTNASTNAASYEQDSGPLGMACFCHRIESMFGQLSTQMKRQQEALEGLQARMDAAATVGALSELSGKVGRRLRDLEERSVLLEHAVDPKRAGPGTAGHLAARNAAELAEANRRLATRAGIDELRAVRAEAKAELTDESRALQEKLAHQVVVEKLEGSLETLRGQVAALGGVVNCKADAAQLASLEATAAKIETHQDFHARMSGDLKALQQMHDRLHGDFRREAAAGAASRSALRDLSTEVEGKADGGEAAAMATALRVLQKKVAAAATKAFAEQLQATQAQLLRDAAALQAGLSKEAVARAAALEAIVEAVDGKASVARMEEKADAARVARDLAGVQRALGGRMDAGDGRAAEHRRVLDDLERRVGIATRFIDWYAERGEGYEHNFGVVERELSVLAKRSDPSGGHRKPYSGLVRTTQRPMA